jgi:small subunit ribosomal protein S16
MRMGKKKQPSYRVVAADARSPRDGRFIEIVGIYDPRAEPSSIRIENDKAVDWLRKGAQPTDSVRRLLQISGAWDDFTAQAAAARSAAKAAGAGAAKRATKTTAKASGAGKASASKAGAGPAKAAAKQSTAKASATSKASKTTKSSSRSTGTAKQATKRTAKSAEGEAAPATATDEDAS